MNKRAFRNTALRCLLTSAVAFYSMQADRSRANAVTPARPPSPEESQNLYVANQATNSITVYPANANGNVAPRRTIAGPKTQLATPAALAVDFVGHLYVANGTHILEFAPAAQGDVAPLRVLSLPFPGAVFAVVTALTVDDDLAVYAAVVSAPAGGQLSGYLLRYAPQSIVPGATYVVGNADTSLTLDSSGTRVLSAVNAFRSCAATGVDAIAKTFSASSRASVLISDPDLCVIRSIVDDRLTASYLLTSTNVTGYARYAEHAVTPPGQHPVPLARVSTGPAGGFLALDVRRRIFDATAFGSSVAVFDPAAQGRAVPERVIAGPATHLAAIGGIAIGGYPLVATTR